MKNNKNNRNNRRRKGARNNMGRRYIPGRPTSLVVDIPLTLPDMTAFNVVAVSMDPKAHTSTRAYLLSQIYNKYKVINAQVDFTTTSSYDVSSGALAVIYQASETKQLPLTTAGAIAQAKEGCGDLFAVKFNRAWQVPRSQLKNITEGYTPGEAETPGRIVLATASTADLAAPGICTLKMTYRFFGATSPDETAAQEVTKTVKVGGDTVDLTDQLWPEGYNPDKNWVGLPAYINSCFSDEEDERRTVYITTTGDNLILTGPNFEAMLQALNGDDIVTFNTFMADYILNKVSKRPDGESYLVKMTPGLVSNKQIKNIDNLPTIVNNVYTDTNSSIRVDNLNDENRIRTDVLQPVQVTNELINGAKVNLATDSTIVAPLPVPIDDQSKGFFANLLTGAITAAIPGGAADSDIARVKLHYPVGGDVDGVSYPPVNVPEVSGDPNYYGSFINHDILLPDLPGESPGTRLKQFLRRFATEAMSLVPNLTKPNFGSNVVTYDPPVERRYQYIKATIDDPAFNLPISMNVAKRNGQEPTADTHFFYVGDEVPEQFVDKEVKVYNISQQEYDNLVINRPIDVAMLNIYPNISITD